MVSEYPSIYWIDKTRNGHEHFEKYKFEGEPNFKNLEKFVNKYKVGEWERHYLNKDESLLK